jgi:hypothetical protein
LFASDVENEAFWLSGVSWRAGDGKAFSWVEQSDWKKIKNSSQWQRRSSRPSPQILTNRLFCQVQKVLDNMYTLAEAVRLMRESGQSEPPKPDAHLE